MKTWDDVQQAAIGWSEDPWRLNVTAALFHQAVTLVEMGELTREQAMIQLALGLAEMTQKLIAKWRAEAAAEQRVSFCADELEAALQGIQSENGKEAGNG